MKSATIAAAVLASVAIAQPHGHQRRHQHEKRDVVVEWETVWETATVIIEDSTTETILPSKPAGQFFQTVTTSTSTSVTTPSTTSTPVVKASSVPVVEVPTTTSITPVVKASSSVQVVDVPTTTSTTPVVVPTTTAVVVAAPAESTTTAAAPAETTASSNTGTTTGTNTKTGKMTYYAPGLGSCGYDDSGTDETKNIIAVDISFFQAISSLTSYGIDQPANPLCDQEITISYGGATTTGVIRDSCPGCGHLGIDVTEKTFQELTGGSLDAGHLEVTWWFNSGKY